MVSWSATTNTSRFCSASLASSSAFACTSTCRPFTDRTRLMRFDSALTWFSASASRATDSTDSRFALSIAAALCAFCRSIRRWTSSVNRSDSLEIRPEKYFTASGSSAGVADRFGEREIAPAGVFSSCETLVTKSRRMISKRRCSLMSEMKIANRLSAICPTRTCR